MLVLERVLAELDSARACLYFL